MNKENYDSAKVMGDIRISDEVVANIAAIAAKEIEGVARVSGYKGKEPAAFAGVRNRSRNIRVEMCDRLVSVDMSLVLKYGYTLSDTASQVQERVKNSIESMTGLEVADVNVRIEGIEVE